MTSTERPAEDSGPRRPMTVDIAQAEALLADGEITAVHGVALWGSNYAMLVRVRHQDVEATAVYKPQRGERPLWDFPDGTLCRREVAAYHVSQALGWHLVPPTVLRRGPHGLGSLQLFVEHDPDVNYFSLDPHFEDQLRRFALFDYLVNNTDRKGGHLLLDTHGKLWGIDHGLTFHTTPKLRTVIWDFAMQPVPNELVGGLQALCDQLDDADSPLVCALTPLLSRAEIGAVQRRVQRLLEARTFPRPGPGPNHPWPPV